MQDGRKYSHILGADYVAHLRFPEANNDHMAFKSLHRIVNWVKHSCLRYDDSPIGKDALERFVDGAEVILQF